MQKQAVDKLIKRIKSCYNYQSIYAMEDGFNSVGLTIQTTPKNRMILCKIVEGTASAKEVGSDYIFLGNLENITEFNERAEQKIIDFVLNNASNAGTITNDAKVWRNGVRMYESTVFVESEEINCIANVLID